MYELNKKTKNDTLLVLIAISLYSMHLLRNVFPAYAYISFLVPVVFIFYIMAREGSELKINKLSFCIAMCYVVLTILIYIISIFSFPQLNYFIPISRYCYMFPFMFLVVFLLKHEWQYVKSMKLIAFFLFICSLSIIFQVLTHHPISWFAHSSNRMGNVRYASLAGSLTSFGCLGGFGLLISYYLFKGFVRNILFTVIVIGMLLTLQKAALINILLSIFFVTLSKKLYEKFTLIFVFSALILFLYVFGGDYIKSTVDDVLFHRAIHTSDVGLFYSMWQRIWLLPSVLFNRYGWSGLLFGVGFIGGSGSVGFADYPMSHSSFFDLLFMGGVINLVFFIFVIFLVYSKLQKQKKFSHVLNTNLLMLSRYLFCMLLINAPFTSLIYLQPYNGLIYYLVVMFTLQVRYSLPVPSRLKQ